MFPISSTTQLWIAAGKLLALNGEEFFLLWAKVAKRFEAEEIHDLRVSSRRLREGIALFAPCFPVKGLSRLKKELKRVTGILGSLRNTDEAILFFSTLTPEERVSADAEIRELLVHLEQEREAARARLKGELKALRPGSLKSDLSALLRQPRLFGNNSVDPFLGFSRFADGAIAVRARPLGELLPEALDEANLGAQHQLRIAVKRLRYRLEILEPLFKSGFPEMHDALKRYQEVLGKLHDLDVFAELVPDRIPEGPARQSLLRTVAARRSHLYAFFIDLFDSFPVDAVGAQARSSL